MTGGAGTGQAVLSSDRRSARGSDRAPSSALSAWKTRLMGLTARRYDGHGEYRHHPITSRFRIKRECLGPRERRIDRGTFFSESFFGGGLGGTGLVKVLLGVGQVRSGGSGGGFRSSEVFFGGGFLAFGTLDSFAGRLDRQRDRLRASLGGRGGLGGVLAIASGSEGSDKLEGAPG